MSQVAYSLSQVTQLTGIKAHTLRVWERRYNFLLPKRRPSGARIYSDDEVKVLLQVRILLSSGFRISKIVKMSADEILARTNEIYRVGNGSDEVYIQNLIQAMLDYDESKFQDIFKKLSDKQGLFEVFTLIIYPFLRRVGGLWVNSEIIPVHEHFISNLIRQKLISAIDLLPAVNVNAKTVVLFLPESEGHEIALLMAYYAFKKAGWRVIYLGLRVPLEDLDNVFFKINPEFGFTFIQIPRKEYSDRLLKLLTEHQDFNLLLSGTKVSLEKLIAHERCSFMERPIALQEYLKFN